MPPSELPRWVHLLTLLHQLLPCRRSVAFFADISGGTFDETFPQVDPFPVQALLVPLDGYIRLETRYGAKTQFATMAPPEWERGASGQPRMRAQQPPLPVPFGVPHVVRSEGPATSCWAYVFGVVGEGSNKVL